MISGWSDWVASNQIITKNLQAIGIDSNVKLEPDWNSWFPNAFATKNPTLLWQNGSQASPYGFFNANLSQNALHPVGSGRLDDRQLVAHFTNAQATGLLEPVEGHARREEAARDRDAAREDLPAAACRSSRSSSGRGGRRTARSTSTASTRRRTSTATRSSRTYPGQPPLVHPHLPRRQGRRVTRAPGGRRAGRSVPPGAILGHDRPCAGSFADSSSTSFAVWVALTLNFLLPRLMPGDPIGGVLQRLSPAQIRRTRGSSRPTRRCSAAAKASIWHDYVVYLHRLAHLDFGISTSNYPTPVSEVDRPDAALLDLPRRRRVPPRVRARHGDRDGRRVAPRRRASTPSSSRR